LRERLGSTGLGHGVAIPHRIKGLKAANGCGVLAASADRLDAPDEQAVGLLIFFAGAKLRPKSTLRILSKSLNSSATPRFAKTQDQCRCSSAWIVASWQSVHTVSS
jgi:mannitol/fructose-specific phosphotransferase system IIA component (Ntr-type)